MHFIAIGFELVIGAAIAWLAIGLSVHCFQSACNGIANAIENSRRERELERAQWAEESARRDLARARGQVATSSIEWEVIIPVLAVSAGLVFLIFGPR